MAADRQRTTSTDASSPESARVVGRAEPCPDGTRAVGLPNAAPSSESRPGVGDLDRSASGFLHCGMRVAVLTVLLAGLAIQAQAASRVKIGEQGRLRQTIVGCRAKDDSARVFQLIAANDKEAAIAYAQRAFPRCRAVEGDTRGVVEDQSFSPDMVCLRAKGDPDCFWLPTSIVALP